MCRTFHTTGFCPYGLRCHFIHNDDERRHPSSSLILDSTAGPYQTTSPVRHQSCTSPLGHNGGLTSTSDGVGGLTGGLQLGVPPHCQPVFASSTSSSSSSTFEVQHRGRPILARGSTLVPPEAGGRFSSTHSYENQHVLLDGDLTATTVHAPCA